MTLANSSVRKVSIAVIFTLPFSLLVPSRLLTRYSIGDDLRPLVIYHNMFIAAHGSRALRRTRRRKRKGNHRMAHRKSALKVLKPETDDALQRRGAGNL